jgi:hypothetical protein
MKILGLLVAPALLFSGLARAENPVTVHEWGTFTSLQDENGKAIGGINVDDEPVPDFVYTAGTHRVAALNQNRWTFGLPPYCAFAGKGGTLAPCGDPQVTMRLETPVLYIYPPKGHAAASVPPLDVHVDFHSGILSQYYPYATILGAPAEGNGPVDINDQTMSGLYWSGVRLGSSGELVATDDKVWTTPRETSAPELEVKATVFDPTTQKNVETTQTEHFLFYRGVGHLESPLHISSTETLPSPTAGPLSIDPAPYPETFKSTGWLADIRPDGTCAFTALPSFSIPEKAAWIPKGCQYGAGDFSADNLVRLKSSMQNALVAAGLYPDEASAMLRTWDLSYFKSPGLRFFYIVPRAWVDNVLPLKVTGAPVAITRVMVGRIELISPEQKATLARLAREPYADLAALKRDATQLLNTSPRFKMQEKAGFESGERPLSELGLTLSPGVRDYLSLGRFRDALIVHEEQVHPSDNFARFIKENDLAAAP